MDPAELVKLIEILNPSNRPGRITVITRMGADKLRAKLPHLIRAVRSAGQVVTWVTDPMHGNTVVAPCALRTRHFGSIVVSDILSFGCPTAVAFWERLGVAPASVFSASVLELWNMPLPPLIPQRHRAVFLMLCCWNLWKHRNAVVFDAQRPCLRRLLRTCVEDARLWAHRLPADDASIPESWCSIFSPM
jgi:hypothetical protein